MRNITADTHWQLWWSSSGTGTSWEVLAAFWKEKKGEGQGECTLSGGDGGCTETNKNELFCVASLLLHRASRRLWKHRFNHRFLRGEVAPAGAYWAPSRGGNAEECVGAEKRGVFQIAPFCTKQEKIFSGRKCARWGKKRTARKRRTNRTLQKPST